MGPTAEEEHGGRGMKKRDLKRIQVMTKMCVCVRVCVLGLKGICCVISAVISW